MITTKVYTSIKSINQKKWDSCFYNSVEDYNYLLALENSNIKGFTHLYYTVEKNNDLLVACPAFITNYSIKTMANKFLKKLIPEFIGFKLLCISSCFSENCLLGFNNELSIEQKNEYLSLLLKFFKQDAKKRKIKFLGIRDLNEEYFKNFSSIIINNNFTLCKSLPSAVLPIKWNSYEEYLKTACTKVTRKEIKRKLKDTNEVLIVKKNNIDDIIDELYLLYKDTEGRSEWHFGELTKEYFTLLLKHSPKIFCNLYIVNKKLLAANLLLQNENILLDKFFCMSYKEGRKYNLYVLSWIHNIEYCIQNNIKIYQAGQTGYTNKKRYGCEFINNYVGFFYNNKIINWLFKVLSPKLIAFDLEKELKNYNK